MLFWGNRIYCIFRSLLTNIKFFVPWCLRHYSRHHSGKRKRGLKVALSIKCDLNSTETGQGHTAQHTIEYIAKPSIKFVSNSKRTIRSNSHVIISVDISGVILYGVISRDFVILLFSYSLIETWLGALLHSIRGGGRL